MLNTASGCLPVIDTIQCPKTKECKNDQCFWRQRDVHGRSPFVHPLLVEEMRSKHKALEEKYGKPYFPELFVEVGTNCLYLCCPDFRK